MTDSLALMPPIDTLDADMLDASGVVLLRDLLYGSDDVLFHDLFYETDDDDAARDDFRRWYAREYAREGDLEPVTKKVGAGLFALTKPTPRDGIERLAAM